MVLTKKGARLAEREALARASSWDVRPGVYHGLSSRAACKTQGLEALCISRERSESYLWMAVRSNEARGVDIKGLS